MIISNKNVIILFSFTLISIFTQIISQCTTPLQCFTDAVAMLKQDRQEMRLQLENYQKLYSEAITEIKNIKDSFQMEIKSLNDKLNNLSAQTNNEIQNLKNVINGTYFIR